MRVRRAVATDHGAIAGVVGSAFGATDQGQGRTVVELVDLLRTSGHARVELVAEDQGAGEGLGAVVGHVLLSHSWLDAPDRLVDVLVLSPLSVHPDHQRRGVGRALLDAAIAAAQEVGAPAVFLEGDPRFYGRLGWERGDDHGFTPPSTRIPDAAFQVVVLPAHEPWMTGALAYCDPFWALDCVGLRP